MPKLRIGPAPEPPAKPPHFPSVQKPELFSQLFHTSWRDIVIPIAAMRVTMSQDLVEHKYWGVDAASVEATGRAPMQIEATIPFVNGIVPGKGEAWGVEPDQNKDLYPGVFRLFLKAFADRTSGFLKHPELGDILCKPQSLDFSHDAMRRDGVEVTARWVETVDEDFPLVDLDDGASPLQSAVIEALSLDASEDDLLKLVPEAAFPDESFESMINKVTGFVDGVTNTVQRVQNLPKQLVHRVERLQNSIDRARNALAWPIVEAAEKLKAPFIGQTASIPSAPTRPIAKYKTPCRMPVTALQGAVPSPNSMDDLVKLNPRLAAATEVEEGKAIYYYA